MKSIGLYVNPDREGAVQAAKHAASILFDLGAECCAEPSIVQSLPENIRSRIHVLHAAEFERFADLVIVFGGDGTMLTAARLFSGSDLPLMGVNVGRLGFLAEFNLEELPKALKDVLSGDYRIVDRTLLEAQVGGKTIHAFNEIVFEKKESSRLITTHIAHQQYLIASYRADGVIIATPTGSTAYSLSCGGPIITPSSSVLCITPISPHSLTMRPLIIPDTLELTVKVDAPDGEARMVADGQIELSITKQDQVLIRRSSTQVKIVKHADSTFFDLLRNKLLWSVDPSAFEQSTDEKH
jgi:NAD+ kinase